MKILITGAAGLIGRYLAEKLSAEGHSIVAWMLPQESLPSVLDAVVVKENLLSSEPVARVLGETAPDAVIHLAAQSFPMRSWEAPAETMQINYDSTLHLLQALRLSGATSTRFLFASSSSVYASSKDGAPIAETHPLAPENPYAVSKMAGDAAIALYSRAFGLTAISFRPFFLIGPQKKGDVASDIARRVVAIERGGPALLKTGRTDVSRDWVDVRDGVEAIAALLHRGEKGETYNICTGAGHTVGDLVSEMQKAASVPFETGIDPAFLRPVDEMVRVGDPAKINALGWSPAIPFEQTVRDILDYWRTQP